MGAYDPVPNRSTRRADANADLDVSGIWDYVPKGKPKKQAKYSVIADPSRGKRKLPWGQNYKTGNARD